MRCVLLVVLTCIKIGLTYHCCVMRTWHRVLFIGSQRDDEAVSSGLGYVVHMLVLASKYLEVRSNSGTIMNAIEALIKQTWRRSSLLGCCAINCGFDFIPIFSRIFYEQRIEINHFLTLDCVTIQQVPLRYQLLFYASRSMIRDPVTVRNSYPYMRDPAVDVTAQPLYKKGVEPARFLIAMDWLRRDVDQLLSTRGVTYNPSHGLLQNILHLFSCELCPTMAS